MTAPSKPTTIYRPDVAPAPHLTGKGRCSDCDVTAVIAAEGDVKVCPKCFGVLWKRDLEAERKKAQAQETIRIATAMKAEEARRRLEQAKQIGEQAISGDKDDAAS